PATIAGRPVRQLVQQPFQFSITRDVEPGRTTMIHSFMNGLAGVHTAPALAVRVARDAGLPNEPVLFVDYPEAGSDPASRDISLDLDSRDWSGGSAIAFRVRPSRATRLSVSFIDRNHVVYTAWTNLEADMWQPVRIAFDAIRPNPY